MNSAKKDICSSLSQAKILLGLILKLKSSTIKAFSFPSFMLKVLFPTSEPKPIIQGHFSFARESLNHANICVLMEIHYQSVFCYADVLGEGKKEIVYFLKPFKLQAKLDQTDDMSYFRNPKS